MEDDDKKKARLPRLKRPADGRDPRFPMRFILLWVVILIMIPLFLKFRPFQPENIEKLDTGKLRALVEEGAVKRVTVLAASGDPVETIEGEYEQTDPTG